MQTTVRKWGNSLALRLPQSLAAELGLGDGGAVSLSREGDALVVRPARARFKLEDLLVNARPSQEVDWGKPQGGEEW